MAVENGVTTPTELPKFRYDAKLANQIERKWQKLWEENGTYVTENPTPEQLKQSSTARNPEQKESYFIMDMFPYPSGAGLHVGHPLGYIATDVVARFQRMNNKLVLHALGYDAFGLPAEQYAVQTGQHPRITTEDNIKNMKVQLKMLGLAHDPSRTFATIDDDYVRWTQWIFSRLYESYFDEQLQKARPISELIDKFRQSKVVPTDAQGNTYPNWDDLDLKTQSTILNNYRLAYQSYSPVNWCPGLGTVLANEEVTADGRSERGNFPVFQRNLQQWSMRITTYADRLVNDLELIDWPEKVKLMQRNWIGKSQGAYINFPLINASSSSTQLEELAENLDQLQVFTTRPDTIRGATFMVVSPEHPLVDQVSDQQRKVVAEYVEQANHKSAVERQQDAGKKTGVYLGVDVLNPVTQAKLPVYVADYVLMGYGTGAIMAVPADDERDEQFAQTYGIEIDCDYEKYATIELAIKAVQDLEVGQGTTIFRLRDWLFSRQRYWGEPFPIVYDDAGVPYLLPDEYLPVTLPDVPNYQPRTYDPDDADSEPEPPLGRNDEFKYISLDLNDGRGLRQFTRETNTMPNWAGSCWYYLRYLDVQHSSKSADSTVVDSELDKFWLGSNHNSTVGNSGGVDLYVGGVEHAVLHLLYARFWHKALYDLGYVSSPEPFHKLFNQGYVQAYAYTDERGQYVQADEVQELQPGVFTLNGQVVNREYGKMGKSLKNVVTPDDMAKQFGADTFRIYEMSMGPLDLSRPWETRAVIGAQRYLQRLYRLVVNEATGELVINHNTPSEETLRALNKTIVAVKQEMANMRLNTAITKLIEYCNHLTAVLNASGSVARSAVEPLVQMTSPFAPHIAEELWQRLGHADTITYQPFPVPDSSYLVDDVVSVGVQVNGKVRATLTISSTATAEEFEQAALELEQIQAHIAGKTIRKAVVVPRKIVNFVVG